MLAQHSLCSATPNPLNGNGIGMGHVYQKPNTKINTKLNFTKSLSLPCDQCDQCDQYLQVTDHKCRRLRYSATSVVQVVLHSLVQPNHPYPSDYTLLARFSTFVSKILPRSTMFGNETYSQATDLVRASEVLGVSD